MEQFKVTIEKDSDGSYIAYDVDNDKYVLLGRGDTVQEAKDDFINSVDEIRQSAIKRGEAVDEILTNAPEFSFDLASLFEYYKMINVSAFARFIGINGTLMRQYRQGGTYISDKQLMKIQQGINRLGEELASIKLV